MTNGMMNMTPIRIKVGQGLDECECVTWLDWPKVGPTEGAAHADHPYCIIFPEIPIRIMEWTNNVNVRCIKETRRSIKEKEKYYSIVQQCEMPPLYTKVLQEAASDAPFESIFF